MDNHDTATANQSELCFEPLPPRKPQRPHRSQATSLAAHQDSLPRAGSQRRKIYDCIVAGGRDGRTRWEIHKATGILYGSVPSHTAKLIADGMVIETTATRPTDNGGAAHVLIAAEVANDA